MNYYELMDRLDKFCLEYKDLDFREMPVTCNKVAGVECLCIKDMEGMILETIVLNKEELNEVR